MKYFIDTEFIEGFHKAFLGKRRHFIDLISIGIFCEDKREYYAISNEFNPNDADKWVKENVISKLPEKIFNGYNVQDAKLWKSNKQIAKEIFEFICPISTASDWSGVGSLEDGMEHYLISNPPEIYAYYADYDWVVFCSLFGRMVDLPKGFPRYCRDLKQLLDEKREGNINIPIPKQLNEHNALDDAKWNYQLYESLIAVKNTNSKF